MKYLSLALCCVLAFMGREYYKAVRHEFYQVWDSLEEVKNSAKRESDSDVDSKCTKATDD